MARSPCRSAAQGENRRRSIQLSLCPVAFFPATSSSERLCRMICNVCSATPRGTSAAFENPLASKASNICQVTYRFDSCCAHQIQLYIIQRLALANVIVVGSRKQAQFVASADGLCTKKQRPDQPAALLVWECNLASGAQAAFVA